MVGVDGVIPDSREGSCGELSGGTGQTTLLHLTVRQKIDEIFDFGQSFGGRFRSFSKIVCSYTFVM